MNEVDAITDLLYGEGQPMQGGDLTLDEAMALGDTHVIYKPYRIVRDWIWADLDVNEEGEKEFEKRGFEPVMVYAHHVMYDSDHRFEIGNWVRTTPLLRFTPPCTFETANTVYILVGEGKRKTTTVKAIMSIF